MRELGLPAPELQHDLCDRGRFVARLDFWWPEHGVVGEFDGRSKYGIDVDTSDPAAALWRAREWVGPISLPRWSPCNLIRAAPIAQSAERLHGKEKVKGSIPFRGSVVCSDPARRRGSGLIDSGGVAQSVRAHDS